MSALTTLYTLSMSTRDIADLTDKRHDNVMRDTRAILVELHGEGGLLKFEEAYTDPKNKQQFTMYNLPKRETLILISGYSVTMRAKIVDRWLELEAAEAKPAPEPKPLPNALRDLPGHLEGLSLDVPPNWPELRNIPDAEAVLAAMWKPKHEKKQLPIQTGEAKARMAKRIAAWLSERPEGATTAEVWQEFFSPYDKAAAVYSVLELLIQGDYRFDNHIVPRTRPLLQTALTHKKLEDLVERRARALMAQEIVAAGAIPACVERGASDAVLAASLLAGQRAVVRFELDGRPTLEWLRGNEMILSQAAFINLHEQILDRDGLAIVPKALVEAAKAMQQALGVG